MTEKKIKLLVIGMVLFGLILQGYYALESMSSVTAIKRPEVGEEAKDITLIMKGEDVYEEVTFTVDEQQPSKEAIDRYLDLAKQEIEESFLGENRSFDEIRKNVVLKDSYANGMVDARWSFSPRKIITSEGKIEFDELEEDTPIVCTAILNALDKELSYSFPVCVKVPNANEKDGFLYYIKKVLKEKNKEGKEEFVLPTDLYGKSITWNKKIPYTGFEISLLGLFMGILLIFGNKYDAKKEVKNKLDMFEQFYPEIISGLTLYMGAGLSSRQAFEKMGEIYQKQRNKTGIKKEPYENILILNRELHDGKNTRNAYEDFGRRCLHPAYKKMMLLFEQNMRKGNEYLLEQLEREERNVYETRLRKIKSAGETASTKLLIPMGGLLGMVLIVLVVPAFFTIQI